MAKRPTYRIRDWSENFENSESRKVKRASYVCLPNKHDGKTFRRIAKHTRGPEIFAAWCLILEVASKMPNRGILSDADGPLDADDLSDKTGFASEIFSLALKTLSQPKFGWICSDEVTSNIPEHPDGTPDSPGTPGNAGLEQNRTEQKGREQKLPAVAGHRDEPTPWSVSPHRAFISHYFDLFTKRYGVAPTFRDGRDGAHVKTILKAVQKDQGKAKGMLDAFLADGAEWLIGGRHSLGQLVSVIDRYRIPVAHAQANGEGFDEPAEFTDDLREIAFREGAES